MVARGLRVVGHHEQRGVLPRRQVREVLHDRAQRAVAVGDLFGDRRDAGPEAGVIGGQPDVGVARLAPARDERAVVAHELLRAPLVADAQVPARIVQVDVTVEHRGRRNVQRVEPAEALRRRVLVVDAGELRIVGFGIGRVAFVVTADAHEVAVVAERDADGARAR